MHVSCFLIVTQTSFSSFAAGIYYSVYMPLLASRGPPPPFLHCLLTCVPHMRAFPQHGSCRPHKHYTDVFARFHSRGCVGYHRLCRLDSPGPWCRLLLSPGGHLDVSPPDHSHVCHQIWTHHTAAGHSVAQVRIHPCLCHNPATLIYSVGTIRARSARCKSVLYERMNDGHDLIYFRRCMYSNLPDDMQT
jgi:hypothetical protein